MKKIILGMLAILILAKLFATSNIDGTSKIFAPFAVPEFALETLDGKDALATKDIANGTYLLSFMSYSCGYCTKQSKYMSENGFFLPVYLISSNIDKEGVEKWVSENNIKPYYKKFGIKGNHLGRDMDVSAVPTSFVVHDGMVIKKIVGAIDAVEEARLKSFVENMPKIEKDK